MKKKFLMFAIVLGLIAFVMPAQASTLTLDYDFEFSGAQAPEGQAPWLTATFDDSYGASNQVLLTLETDGLVGTESVDDWYFNFDPDLVLQKEIEEETLREVIATWPP